MHKKITFIEVWNFVNKKFIVRARMEIVNANWTISEQGLQNVAMLERAAMSTKSAL